MTLPILRLNQGDPSEARIYYCVHFVAEALGYFAEAGVAVEFVTTAEGGHTVRGGQIPALLSGQADLTVGGPMVAMKMDQSGEALLVTFCAVAQGNPWVLAASPQRAAQTRSLADIAGARVIDVANVGTASMTFRWLLKAAELQVTLVAGSGDEAADLAAVAQGQADFALHSLHALGPAMARGDLGLAVNLAPLTGEIPWSAYIALPSRLAELRPAFAAFVRAIARAQGWMAQTPPRAIARLVARHYPEQSEDALALSLQGYLASEVLPAAPGISDESFARFGALLQGIGWLEAQPDMGRLLDMSLVKEELTWT